MGMSLPFVSVTIILIGITVLVSWLAFNNPRLMERLLLWPPAIQRQHQYDRLITHGFVHADFQHLLFNMITLFFFGRLVEQFFADYIGSIGFVLFYLSALLVAILPTYLRHRQDPRYRSLGASGAVSAVLFAFILLQPWSMIFVFFLPVPAIVYGVIYVGYSIWMDRQGHGNVNHSAHLWGAGYGVLFTLLMEPRVGPVFLERVLHPSFG
jgi:membrane associated rhomboid family serine protease